jgi:hypothetical protein
MEKLKDILIPNRIVITDDKIISDILLMNTVNVIVFQETGGWCPTRIGIVDEHYKVFLWKDINSRDWKYLLTVSICSWMHNIPVFDIAGAGSKDDKLVHPDSFRVSGAIKLYILLIEIDKYKYNVDEDILLEEFKMLKQSKKYEQRAIELEQYMERIHYTDDGVKLITKMV